MKCWDIYLFCVLYIFLYLRDNEIFSELNPMFAVINVLFSMAVDN
jgi:hypothetical protein